MNNPSVALILKVSVLMTPLFKFFVDLMINVKQKNSNLGPVYMKEVESLVGEVTRGGSTPPIM